MWTVYAVTLEVAPFNGAQVTKWLSQGDLAKLGGFVPEAGAKVITRKVRNLGELCDLNRGL